MPRTDSLKSAQIRWPKCSKKTAHHTAQRETDRQSHREGETETETRRVRQKGRGPRGAVRGERKDSGGVEAVRMQQPWESSGEGRTGRQPFSRVTGHPGPWLGVRWTLPSKLTPQ